MQKSAPVYSLADEQRARSDSSAWASFTAPGDTAELYASWLSLLAARIARSRAAVLLTRECADGAFSFAAVWPGPRRDMQYLSPVAQRALQGREGVVTAPGGEDPPGWGWPSPCRLPGRSRRATLRGGGLRPRPRPVDRTAGGAA